MKRLLLIFMLLIPVAYGATLQGTIYDLDLEPAKNSVLNINTIPEQVLVSKDGTYKFDINPGEYILEVKYEDILHTEEITIVENGVFNSDILLLPNIDFEEEDLSIEDTEIDEGLDVQMITIVAFIIFLIILAFVFWNKRKSKKTYLDQELTDDIIEFIKKEGGRVTQKDIRKNFAYSEAKISLAVSELESKGIVEKIKKSKGNIIILKN